MNIVDVDNDSFSPPDDCDDLSASINPNADEICDGVDNDCDDQVDEEVLNDCGQCGAVPTERCDELDNDCDGQTDEGTLNACGACGDVPGELCDGRDNDCDGQTDEGTLNACGDCGAVPGELCDGRDNDCDGQTDEGTLNACGDCGAVPGELCDGRDNDCDGQTDEGLPLNSCGICGTLPIESCDGVDNDCDGQVDEDLITPCFALKNTISSLNNVFNFGLSITLVGDLDGDGVNDAIIRGERNGRIRVFAYSGNAEFLWNVEGNEGFATAIAAGRFFGGDSIYIAMNDPTNDRLIIYNDQGDSYVTVGTPEGEVTALTTLYGTRDSLVLGIPEADNNSGLIRRLRFRTSLPNEPVTVFSTYGNFDEEWGERLYNIDNLIGNFSDDILFTQIFNQRGRDDVGTGLMDGSTGIDVSGSLFSVNEYTDFSFAYDLAIGIFDPQSNRSFAYGAPLVSNSQDNQGAIYTLHSRDSGYVQGATIFGDEVDNAIGIQLSTLTRLNASADTLVIGGYNDLTYRDFSVGGPRLDVPLPANDLFIGFGLAIASTPSSDGTYQMWVSGLSEVGGESRVWIMSAR